jgi:hypothetical protein
MYGSKVKAKWVSKGNLTSLKQRYKLTKKFYLANKLLFKGPYSHPMVGKARSKGSN